MMLSAPPSLAARSSLEEMLESLRRQDECERPKDLPPALPARPTSRARLPSARKSLPTDFKVGEENGAKANLESDEKTSSLNGKEDGKRKEKELGVKKNNSFGSKKLRREQKAVDSPYEGGVVLDERKVDEVLEVNKMKLAKSGEVEWEDNLVYFINKVTIFLAVILLLAICLCYFSIVSYIGFYLYFPFFGCVNEVCMLSEVLE